MEFNLQMEIIILCMRYLCVWDVGGPKHCCRLRLIRMHDGVFGIFFFFAYFCTTIFLVSSFRLNFRSIFLNMQVTFIRKVNLFVIKRNAIQRTNRNNSDGFHHIFVWFFDFWLHNVAKRRENGFSLSLSDILHHFRE